MQSTSANNRTSPRVIVARDNKNEQLMEKITLLENKRILLAVTGSIAVYKAIDLASKLTQAGALVEVIMTGAAQQFVTPLAFQSVTGRAVYTDMWQADTSGGGIEASFARGNGRGGTLTTSGGGIKVTLDPQVDLFIDASGSSVRKSGRPATQLVRSSAPHSPRDSARSQPRVAGSLR